MPQTMIEQVAARDLDEMLRFYQRQPWGSKRDNIHAGLVAATIARVMGGEKAKSITYEDFMLTDRKEHARRKTMQTVNWLKRVARPKKRKNG